MTAVGFIELANEDKREFVFRQMELNKFTLKCNSANIDCARACGYCKGHKRGIDIGMPAVDEASRW